MTNVLKLNLLLLVFILPLLPTVNSFGFEETKELAFIFLTSLALIWWTVLVLAGKLEINWTKLHWVGVLFLLVLFTSSVFGVNPEISFFGSNPYFQGWILYLYLFLFSLIVASVDIKITTWAKVLSISAFLVAIAALRQWLEMGNKPLSTFGQHNLYSGYLLLVLPFLGWLIIKAKGRVKLAWLLIGLILLLAIAVSLSKAAIILSLGLVISTFIYFIFDTKRNRLILSTVVIGMLVALSAGFLIKPLAVPALNTNLNQLDPFNPNYSAENRVYFWPVIVDLIAQRPALGYGLENLQTEFTRFSGFNTLFSKPPVYFDLRNLTLNRSHNYILDLLVFSGVLGLAAWLLLVWLIFKQSRSNLIKLALVVYLIWTGIQIQSSVHLVYFWLLAGIVRQKT